MNWEDVMSQGGIWAIFCYVLVKEVLPMFRPKIDTGSQTRDCAAAHGVLAEKIISSNECRKDESRLTREAIEKLADCFGDLRDELHEWRSEVVLYLKKGNGL
jgi:hypothetical protein